MSSSVFAVIIFVLQRGTSHWGMSHSIFIVIVTVLYRGLRHSVFAVVTFELHLIMSHSIFTVVTIALHTGMTLSIFTVMTIVLFIAFQSHALLSKQISRTENTISQAQKGLRSLCSSSSSPKCTPSSSSEDISHCGVYAFFPFMVWFVTNHTHKFHLNSKNISYTHTAQSWALK